MNISIVLRVVHADALERLRRTSFLVVAVLTMVMGLFFVPPADAPYTTIDLGGFRGIYNAAWIGAMLTMVVTHFVTLFGFYLVRDAIGHDRRSGVGQLLATTPLRRSVYLIAKWLSNWLILTAITATLAATALVMLLARGEAPGVNLWELLAPFLIIGLPAMALVASLAVLFETVSWLRGTLGSVVYFTLFLVSVGGTALGALNPFGVQTLTPSMVAGCVARYGSACDGVASVGINGIGIVPQTFVWEGVPWSMHLVAAHGLWIGIALTMVLLASRHFDRFAGEPAHAPAPTHREHIGAKLAAIAHAPGASALTPAVAQRFPLPLVSTELKLMLKGLPWWWYVVALGLVVACVLAPGDMTRRWLLPVAWLWPLLVWSGMGTREQLHGTWALLFAAPAPLARQLPGTWLAGVALAATTGSGALVNLLLTGDVGGALTWAVGAAFIPALALAVGVWSGSPRLFELVYLLLWYAAVNQVVPFDFLGVTGDGPTFAYTLATIGLLAAAVAGRVRSMRR